MQPAGLPLAGQKGNKVGAHLLRHQVTPTVAAAAAAELGADPQEAGRAVLRLRQPELRGVFERVFGVQTSSGNNEWMRSKLLQAVGLGSHWRPSEGQAQQQDGGGGAPGREDATRSRRARRPRADMAYLDELLGEDSEDEQPATRRSSRGAAVAQKRKAAGAVSGGPSTGSAGKHGRLNAEPAGTATAGLLSDVSNGAAAGVPRPGQQGAAPAPGPVQLSQGAAAVPGQVAPAAGGSLQGLALPASQQPLLGGGLLGLSQEEAAIVQQLLSHQPAFLSAARGAQQEPAGVHQPQPLAAQQQVQPSQPALQLQGMEPQQALWDVGWGHLQQPAVQPLQLHQALALHAPAQPADAMSAQHVQQLLIMQQLRQHMYAALQARQQQMEAEVLREAAQQAQQAQQANTSAAALHAHLQQYAAPAAAAAAPLGSAAPAQEPAGSLSLQAYSAALQDAGLLMQAAQAGSILFGTTSVAQAAAALAAGGTLPPGPLPGLGAAAAAAGGDGPTSHEAAAARAAVRGPAPAPGVAAAGSAPALAAIFASAAHSVPGQGSSNLGVVAPPQQHGVMSVQAPPPLGACAVHAAYSALPSGASCNTQVHPAPKRFVSPFAAQAAVPRAAAPKPAQPADEERHPLASLMQQGEFSFLTLSGLDDARLGPLSSVLPIPSAELQRLFGAYQESPAQLSASLPRPSE